MNFIVDKDEEQKVYESLLENNLNQDVIAEVSRAIALNQKGTKMIPATRGMFDIVSQVENPNQTWLVESFDYYFQIGESRTNTRTDFILPGQSKIVTEIGFSADRIVNNVEIIIENVKWKKVSDFASLYEKMVQFDYENVSIQRSSVEKSGETLDVTFLKFDIINKTSFNYWSPKFHVLIYKDNQLVNVQQVVLDSISSNEVASKSLAIYEKLPLKSQVQIYPDINILDPDVIKGFGNGSGELK